MKFLDVCRLAGCLLMLTAAANAQYQVDGGGRALDANLQVGSGGVNGEGRGLRPGAYQDALVTGNVGGLARFRGDVDYRAPGEFSGRTSADESYQFRLQSLSPQVRSFQDPALLTQRTGAPMLLRSGSGVTAGDVSGQTDRLGAASVYLRRDDVAGLSVRADQRTAASLDAAGRRGAAVPGSRLADLDRVGRALEARTASPLMGVSRPVPLRTRSYVPGQQRLDADGEIPLEELEGDQRAGQALPPAVVAGQQLIRPEETPEARAQARSQRHREWIERAQGPLRLGPAAEPEPQEQDEDDVYAGLLRRAAGDRLGGRPRDEQERKPRLSAEEELAARAEAVLRARRAPAGDEAAFEQLVGQLHYEGAPLATLASGSGTPYDQSLAAAERLMAEGKYLQAESAYGRAMLIPGATPLAAVGRVHAQIGAGLHAAAADGLRRTMLRHPELIAARYAQPVLPAEDRLQAAATDLEDLRNSTDGTDMSLLAGYVAYQRGEPAAARQILDEAYEDARQDPLLPLVRRIWGDAPAGEESSEPTAVEEEASRPEAEDGK